MKLLELPFLFVLTSYVYARREGCDVPLSKDDKGLKFDASSHADGREPYRARIGTPKIWCAKGNIKYTEYLQVNLTSVRHISEIETQGAKWTFLQRFVKTFLISYSMDGKKYRFYKARTNSGSKFVVFNGNTDASRRSLNEIHPAFVAQYVRIYPLQFSNQMCMKVELHGCNKTVDCTHVVKLGQDQSVIINTPSYPLPYRNNAHCNWLIDLPKSDSPFSIVPMDFDVGGSAVDQKSCNRNVVTVYRNHHAFSKYLIGHYCNNSNNVMPREIKPEWPTASLRIVFTGGDNNIARHRGFSLLVRSGKQGYKTGKACWNSTITLNCTDAEKDIEVISAFYGRRQHYPLCSVENSTAANTPLYEDSCKAPDVLPKLKATCDYRNVCKIVVDDMEFPHSCAPGNPLEMFIVYQCNATKPATTTPPPTTTTAPPNTTGSVEITDLDEKKTATDEPHGATTKKLKPDEENGKSIILIAAVAGGVLVIMIVIAIITCICCRKRNTKEGALKMKGVVPSESTQSKVMIESESLYEKIDELEVDPTRYHAEPNKYNQAKPNRYRSLHDTKCGMSENPLYQNAGPAKANFSYDLPKSQNHNNLHRPHSVGNPLQAHKAPKPCDSNYVDILKSPEELPDNSPPIMKYLVPSRNSPPDISVAIPLDRYSDSVDTPTGSSAGGDDVYEAMDGSNA